MAVQVLCFGKLADVAKASLTLHDVHSSDELIKKLQLTYPALIHEKYIIAVDKVVIEGNTSLKEASVVALLPPYSGG